MSFATQPPSLQIADLPADVLRLCARHLFIWDKICLSQACHAFRHVLHAIEYGDEEQIKNKHYMQGQLVYQYNEWMELKRMRAEGHSVMYAPARFTQFVCSENAVKRRLGS